MLKINGVTKKFGSVTALDGINLTVESGSVFGLVGSNGSGKSTLLRIISGVFSADSGEIIIDGESAVENIDVKKRCVFISDYPFFYSDSTLETMASLYRGLYPNWSDEEYDRLCSLFNLNRRWRIISMSKGMQRQAALILALASRPQYLMLDEIFDGLDPVVRQLLKRLLIDAVAERNMTVIIASHNLRELEDICDYVGFLHHGGILLESDIDGLKLDIHKIQVAFREEPENNFLEGFRVVSLTRSGSLFRMVIKGNEEDLMQRLRALNPVFLESLPLTLEEVFINEMEAVGYDNNHII